MADDKVLHRVALNFAHERPELAATIVKEGLISGLDNNGWGTDTMGNPTSISTTGASSISTSGTSPLDMEQDPWRASMTTTSAPAAFHGTGSGPSSSSLSGRHFLDHHENDVWSKESTTKSNINIDWHLELDRASVTFSAERGSFFSKHVVYEVQSRHHRVKVMRRYSDFLWLHDVLVRKYPFRMLPRLPPKKFGAGGSEFLEQRRKALKRFLDIIVAHPVLKGSPVVISFLTLNEDVQHSCSKIPLDEEYVNATTAVAESEDNPNTAIDSELDQLRSKLPAFIQQHALVLAILERQCQRLAESALDYRKIAQTMSGSEDMGLSLFSLDRTGDCVHGKVGCTACRQLDIGMREIGTLVATAGGIYEDQSRNDRDSVVETLRRQVDLSIGMNDVLLRRDKVLQCDMESTQRRLLQAQTRLGTIRARNTITSSAMSVADRKEMDKLESAIATDQAELLVHARRTAHLRVAMFEEMQWLHKNKTFMSLAYAQWTRGMVQSAEKQVESWMDIERVAKALPLLFES